MLNTTSILEVLSLIFRQTLNNVALNRYLTKSRMILRIIPRRKYLNSPTCYINAEYSEEQSVIVTQNINY